MATRTETNVVYAAGLVQGIVLFITVTYVGVNFVVDLLYAVMDPRIRING